MRKFLIVAAVFVGISAYSSAQEGPPLDTSKTTISIDSVAVVKPIFSEDDKNLIDSVGSIVKAANDAETKAVLNDAITTIKNVPKGGGIDDWLLYVFAVLGVLFGVYQYLSRRWHSPPSETTNKIKKKA